MKVISPSAGGGAERWERERAGLAAGAAVDGGDRGCAGVLLVSLARRVIVQTLSACG